MKLSRAIEKMGECLADEPITLFVAPDTTSATLPVQAREEKPVYTEYTINADVDEIPYSARSRSVGFQDDSDYIVLFWGKTLSGLGIDIDDPDVMIKLAKSRMRVRGFLCTVHKTPQRVFKTQDGYAWVEFRCKKYRKNH